MSVPVAWWYSITQLLFRISPLLSLRDRETERVLYVLRDRGYFYTWPRRILSAPRIDLGWWSPQVSTQALFFWTRHVIEISYLMNALVGSFVLPHFQSRWKILAHPPALVFHNASCSHLVLPTLFLIDACDWLVSVWLTGRGVGTTPILLPRLPAVEKLRSCTTCLFIFAQHCHSTHCQLDLQVLVHAWRVLISSIWVD